MLSQCVNALSRNVDDHECFEDATLLAPLLSWEEVKLHIHCKYSLAIAAACLCRSDLPSETILEEYLHTFTKHDNHSYLNAFICTSFSMVNQKNAFVDAVLVGIENQRIDKVSSSVALLGDLIGSCAFELDQVVLDRLVSFSISLAMNGGLVKLFSMQVLLPRLFCNYGYQLSDYSVLLNLFQSSTTQEDSDDLTWFTEIVCLCKSINARILLLSPLFSTPSLWDRVKIQLKPSNQNSSLSYHRACFVVEEAVSISQIPKAIGFWKSYMQAIRGLESNLFDSLKSVWQSVLKLRSFQDKCDILPMSCDEWIEILLVRCLRHPIVVFRRYALFELLANYHGHWCKCFSFSPHFVGTMIMGIEPGTPNLEKVHLDDFLGGFTLEGPFVESVFLCGLKCSLMESMWILSKRFFAFILNCESKLKCFTSQVWDVACRSLLAVQNVMNRFQVVCHDVIQCLCTFSDCDSISNSSVSNIARIVTGDSHRYLSCWFSASNRECFSTREGFELCDEAGVLFGLLTDPQDIKNASKVLLDIWIDSTATHATIDSLMSDVFMSSNVSEIHKEILKQDFSNEWFQASLVTYCKENHENMDISRLLVSAYSFWGYNTSLSTEFVGILRRELGNLEGVRSLIEMMHGHSKVLSLDATYLSVLEINDLQVISRTFSQSHAHACIDVLIHVTKRLEERDVPMDDPALQSLLETAGNCLASGFDMLTLEFFNRFVESAMARFSLSLQQFGLCQTLIAALYQPQYCDPLFIPKLKSVWEKLFHLNFFCPGIMSVQVFGNFLGMQPDLLAYWLDELVECLTYSPPTSTTDRISKNICAPDFVRLFALYFIESSIPKGHSLIAPVIDGVILKVKERDCLCHWQALCILSQKVCLSESESMSLEAICGSVLSLGVQSTRTADPLCRYFIEQALIHLSIALPKMMLPRLLQGVRDYGLSEHQVVSLYLVTTIELLMGLDHDLHSKQLKEISRSFIPWLGGESTFSRRSAQWCVRYFLEGTSEDREIQEILDYLENFPAASRFYTKQLESYNAPKRSLTTWDLVDYIKKSNCLLPAVLDTVAYTDVIVPDERFAAQYDMPFESWFLWFSQTFQPATRKPLEFCDAYYFLTESHSLQNIPKFSNRTIVLGALVGKLPNIAGLTRTSELFGVEQLYFSQATSSLIKRGYKMYEGTAASANHHLEFTSIPKDEIHLELQKLKQNGYQVIGLEQSAKSVQIQDFTFPKDGKVVFLLGMEKQGIPMHLLQMLDCCIEIPQLGLTRSLNVHASGAILLWENFKQIHL